MEVTLQSLKGLVWKSSNSKSEKNQTDRYNLEKRSSGGVPNVTAAVAFTGSANDMQVASSFVCPNTGHLMVESRPATAQHEKKKKSNNSSSNNKRRPLVVRWNECGDDALLNEDIQPHLTVQLPLLDPRLPRVPISKTNRDSNIISTPPRRKKKNNHYLQPSLDESDVSSECGHVGGVTNSTSDLYDDDDDYDDDDYDNADYDNDNDSVQYDRYTTSSEVPMGSVVWSSSGAGMPEIVELNVSVKLDADDLLAMSPLRKQGSTSSFGRALRRYEQEEEEDDKTNAAKAVETTFDIGVAYLVFFASDEGTTVMDLPIKKLKEERSLPRSCKIGIDDDNAYLRIKVDVFPNGKRPGRGAAAAALYSESIMDLHHMQQYQHDQQVLQPILHQLRRAEKMIGHHRNIRIEAERPIQNNNNNNNNSKVLCDLGMLNVVTALSRAMDYWDTNGDQAQLYRMTSMDSSIATAPSLDI